MKECKVVDRPTGQETELTEQEIVERVRKFLADKVDGNWHEDKVTQAALHQHGVDLLLRGGKRNSEHFLIECKGKSHAKNARGRQAVDKEGWLNALGQLVTRMDTQRVIQTGKHKGEPNRAYKYGLGLYWKGAQVALSRIPRVIAKTLNLYVFSVRDDGFVRQWTPSQFGSKYPSEKFQR